MSHSAVRPLTISQPRSGICTQRWPTTGRFEPARKLAIPSTSTHRLWCCIRQDREFLLKPVVPTKEQIDGSYDLVIASQTYRARTSADRKARSCPRTRFPGPLPTGGRLIGVHAYGNDPGSRNHPGCLARRTTICDRPPRTARSCRSRADWNRISDISSQGPTTSPSSGSTCTQCRQRRPSTSARHQSWQRGTPPPMWRKSTSPVSHRQWPPAATWHQPHRLCGNTTVFGSTTSLTSSCVPDAMHTQQPKPR